MARLTFIGLPLCTRANNSGMAAAVRTLREAGIVIRLQEHSNSLIDVGDVPLSEIRKDSGPKNLANFDQFLQDTEGVQSAINGANAEGLIFGLGGECSICVGTLAGLKNRIRGELGIVWIDAHGDFNTPETTPSGYIGGMCLAMACGRGPKLNQIIREGDHLLSEENIVHLGGRSLDPAESESMSSSPMKTYPASALRKEGIASTADLVVRSLADRCDWIVCHLDVDSIDPKIMPAVNFPAQGGLSLEDITAVIAAVERTGKMKLFELAGYNPDIDSNRTCAKRLVTLVSGLFAG